jgi:hypothetical protein
LHAERTEQIGQQTTDEQPNDHVRIFKLELNIKLREVILQILCVGSEQDQCGKARRANGIALGNGFSGGSLLI